MKLFQKRTCSHGAHPVGNLAAHGFSFPDLLVIVAVVMLISALVLPMWINARALGRQSVCAEHLQKVATAILSFSQAEGRLPQDDPGAKGAMGPPPLWWFYKEQVKSELSLKGPSSPADKVFACPNDRGYEENRPFRLSAKFDYGSYVFNGVNLPGYPNIAGRAVSTIKDPAVTLLVTEWTARAPLSWHRSRTGQDNEPFYNDAESVVAFVDGHVDFIPIYYDGMNAAGTRDPISGYKYKYSGD